MISKIPVPMTLLKTSLGIRDDLDIVKIAIVGDTVNFYTLTEGNAAAELNVVEKSKSVMTFSVGANEAG